MNLHRIKESIIIGSFSVSAIFLLTGGLHLALRYKSIPKSEYDRFVRDSPGVQAAYRKSGKNLNQVRELLQNQYQRRNWTYEEFLGFREKPRVSDYINVSEAGFRFNSSDQTLNNQLVSILNKPKAQMNRRLIFVFGGSSTFGYGLFDNQTIPAQIEKISKNDIVLNFGRGYYYSEQENILLSRLIKSGFPKPDVAVFLDGHNERCSLEAYQSQMSSNFDKSSDTQYRWYPEEYAKPYFNLIGRLNDSAVQQGAKINQQQCKMSGGYETPLKNVFSKTLDQRQSLCDLFSIKCLTFLQPAPGLQNVHKYLDSNVREKMALKYRWLRPLFQSRSQAEVVDISNVLSAYDTHQFVDQYHYSPEAASTIASAIKRELDARF